MAKSSTEVYSFGGVRSEQITAPGTLIVDDLSIDRNSVASNPKALAFLDEVDNSINDLAPYTFFIMYGMTPDDNLPRVGTSERRKAAQYFPSSQMKEMEKKVSSYMGSEAKNYFLRRLNIALQESIISKVKKSSIPNEITSIKQAKAVQRQVQSDLSTFAKGIPGGIANIVKSIHDYDLKPLIIESLDRGNEKLAKTINSLPKGRRRQKLEQQLRDQVEFAITMERGEPKSERDRTIIQENTRNSLSYITAKAQVSERQEKRMSTAIESKFDKTTLRYMDKQNKRALYSKYVLPMNSAENFRKASESMAELKAEKDAINAKIERRRQQGREDVEGVGEKSRKVLIEYAMSLLEASQEEALTLAEEAKEKFQETVPSKPGGKLPLGKRIANFARNVACKLTGKPTPEQEFRQSLAIVGHDEKSIKEQMQKAVDERQGVVVKANPVKATPTQTAPTQELQEARREMLSGLSDISVESGAREEANVRNSSDAKPQTLPTVGLENVRVDLVEADSDTEHDSEPEQEQPSRSGVQPKAPVVRTNRINAQQGQGVTGRA